jgi:hypothetical protein
MISEQSIEWAKRHLLRFGGSDVFPPAEDYKALSANWDEVKSHVLNLDLQSYAPKAPYLAFASKADGTYRAVHELDPIDALVITAAIHQLSIDIECYRIPADRQCVFSYRIDPDTDGSFFSKDTENWATFSPRRSVLLNEFQNGFVLIADIADFYNQIYLHRVRNSLDEATSTDKADLCIFVEKFLLTLNLKVSQGVPVGPTFSTILAELVLNDLDRKIVNSGFTFVRWVDDIFVFSEEYQALRTLLHDLSAFLYGTHRLVFNGQKTDILSVSDFKKILEDQEDAHVNKEFESLKEARCNEIFDEVIDELDPYDSSEIDEFAVHEEVIERFEQNEQFQIICTVYRNILERAIATRNYTLIRHVLRKSASLRIRAVEDVVYSHLDELRPNIREVAQYVVSTSRAAIVEQYTERIQQFMLNTESSHAKRWLAYILSASAFKCMNVEERQYGLFDTRDKARISAARSDIVRIKEFRNDLDILGPWDRRGVILSLQKLSRDERNPLLSAIEARGDILEKALCKYVRGMA